MAACTETTRNYHGTPITFCQEDDSDALQERLDLIGRIKRYGQNRLGLIPSRNYLRYASPRQATARRLFMLYTTPEFVIPDRWEPSRHVRSNGTNRCEEEGPCYLWGYDVDDFHDERRHYDDEGYDTYWRTTTNFGSGADITDELFDQELTWWISTVFHEEFHYARMRAGRRNAWDPWVEESLASAFGHAAGLEFIRSSQNDVDLLDDDTVTDAEEQLVRQLERAAFINEYTDRLNALYHRDIPGEVKRDMRDGILQEAGLLGGRPINNAYLWGTHPYTNLLDLALAVYLRNPDIEEFACILRGAPVQRDAVRNYLIRHGGTPAVAHPHQSDSGLRMDEFEPLLHDPQQYQ